MYPWLWIWYPQFQFPFSGSVNQDYKPDTSWFFGSIRPEAGNGTMEKNIFDIASYGKQLGWITEVLLFLEDNKSINTENAPESLEKLKALYQKIEQVKKEHEADSAETIITLLQKLKASDKAQFEQIISKFV